MDVLTQDFSGPSVPQAIPENTLEICSQKCKKLVKKHALYAGRFQYSYPAKHCHSEKGTLHVITAKNRLVALQKNCSVAYLVH